MLADDAMMQVVEEQLAERQLLLPFDLPTNTQKEKAMDEIATSKITAADKKARAKKPGAKPGAKRVRKPIDPKLAAAKKEIEALRKELIIARGAYKVEMRKNKELAARLARIAAVLKPKAKKPSGKKA